MRFSKSLSQRLAQAPDWNVAVFAALASFGVYFCMYAFRKPFTAAHFAGYNFLKIPYKVWLVTAQVVGYMLSKFYGIRFVSALHASKRAVTIVWLIVCAWLALLLFAVTPAPYNIIFLFINGFPLGLVWGLVFSYLEGRKFTEAMGAVLATSFIFSSGVVKSIGNYLVQVKGVGEWWMPFFTGAPFLFPMLVCTWLLHHVPPPTPEDEQLRTKRQPMTRAERQKFVALYLPGLIIIIATYVLLTALRDFRDNFAAELWTELGFGSQPAIFSKTEIPVSILVLCAMAGLIAVRNNFRAFLINHIVIIAGYILCLCATGLFLAHYTNAVVWMTLVGTGLYMAYVPFNALYFERMIASYKIRGNVGFVMYIADSFGYLGSVLVLFLKEFSGVHLSWTSFFVQLVFGVSIFGIIGTLIAARYFRRKYYNTQPEIAPVYAV